MTHYLISNHQFGVGIPCGGESIMHAANRLLELKVDQDHLAMMLIDFTNAFNLVNRSVLINEVRERCPGISKWVEFCYAKPAKLYYNEHILSSAQGVQHGDPLGPMLFSLALHPLVCKMSSECSLDLRSWYLDDGTLVGDSMEVARALQIIREDGATRGLCLNIRKTEVFWPSPDIRCNQLFPPDIGRPVEDVRLLGGPVSLSTEYCSSTILDRVDKTSHLMDCIKKLNDPQSKLLLLRNCAGVSKLYFTMRTTRPQVLDSAQQRFHHHLSQFLRYLVTADGAGFGQLQQRISTLPINYRGLGVYTMEDTNQYCYIASCYQTKYLQSNILQGSTDLGPNFQSALDSYMQICGMSSSSFDINDIAPQPMHHLATRYFDVVTKSIPTTFVCLNGILFYGNATRNPMHKTTSKLSPSMA
ncbi:uncharacterized protein LOC113307792 [Papaver somniferum]|uniref:uncharacterized protein LOC113307792 n=1 Tax=Papaver somniferum TaxID=3469 RepID=UPI000E6F9D3C|nr:uncharacterized protein LOC113307792 [Papaver somniferum]